MLDTELSEELNSMSSFEDPGRELPALLSRFYDYASMRIRLNINFCKHVVFMLILILFAIFRLNISGDNKYYPELIISMWERIQELENEVKELKAGTQEDNQNK